MRDKERKHCSPRVPNEDDRWVCMLRNRVRELLYLTVERVLGLERLKAGF